MSNCCYSPYKVHSSDLTSQQDFTFFNSQKTRLVAVITKCNEPVNPPSSNAILLHELLNCPDNDCDIRWYECPDEMGRTYTILPTPCNVIITSFENGLLNDHCDASIFGSKTFCYGKAHTQTDIYDADNPCTCSFEFDGSNFIVSGTSSDCSEIFSCPECNSQEKMISAFGENALPEPPPEPSEVTDEKEPEEDFNRIQGEQRTVWHNKPDNITGQDTVCFPPKNVINWPEGDGNHEPCLSNDNPSLAVLPSGHAIIAYEDRDLEGKTKISIAIFHSSIKSKNEGSKVYYYRSLSRGKLINDVNTNVYGSGKFEIFDDIYINVTDGVIDPPLQIGFLTGPFRGKLFNIQSVERILQDSGLPKYILSFASEGNSPDFPDSNDAYDVAWFLILKDDDTLPSSDIIKEIVNLSYHTFNGKIVPVSNPSISIPLNNHMVGGDQYIYLTYQAFEEERWKVYLQQICLNDSTKQDPLYEPPYEFLGANSSLVNLNNTNPENLTYKVSQRYSDGIILCAQFYIFLPDGRQVVNCDQDVVDPVNTCNGILEGNPRFATVAATVGLNLPGCSDGVICSDCMPNWNLGDEFVGSYPPTDENVKTAISGTGGDVECITDLSFIPEINSWCVFQSDCHQTYLVDDPYCASPYLSMVYHPEDLWTINIEDNWVTRVLYQMSVNDTLLGGDGNSTGSRLDFMFCIDVSGSMNEEIISIRENVPILAQLLKGKGIDVRFGLTMFDLGIGGPYKQPTSYISCGPENSRMFDGLQDLVSGGFTSDVSILQESLSEWHAWSGGNAAGYVAMQFAVNDAQFQWRSNTAKYILLITDTSDNEAGDIICSGFNNNNASALSTLLSNNIITIVAICITPENGGTCQSGNDGSGYLNLPIETGWTGEPYFNVSGPYNSIFDSIGSSVSIVTGGGRLLERNTTGYEPTFLKDAQLLVTYDGDLSDLWTYERTKLKFTDTVPNLGNVTKGLSSFPYDLSLDKVYGIDAVHILGNINNWVFFAGVGPIVIKQPTIGRFTRGQSSPLLISDYASRARIRTNHRNHVIVAYEDYSNSTPQIKVIGTGDFHQDSITGPKGSRITRFLTAEDFTFNHDVTLSGEGVNQLCDFVIDKNDVTHLTWQSNRDNYWEIYYGNSYNLFDPVRVTKSESRSGFPSIDIDDTGNIFIVYHDNRFGPFEIMMGIKDEDRIIPLLQQDAYLASLRSGYQHYVNNLPIIINNSGILEPGPGTFIGTKISSEAGNDNENYIFSIDTSDGGISSLSSTNSFQVVSIASSRRGILYGATLDNILLQLTSGNEDPYIVIDISQIGNLDIELESLNPSADLTTILDMTIDNVGRIWILLADSPSDAEPYLRIVQVNSVNANILVNQILFNNIDEIKGGITCLNDGTFVLVSYRNGNILFESSTYPTILGNTAQFSWRTIATLSISPIALTSTEDDQIRALVRVVDGFDEIYSISLTGVVSFLHNVGSDSSSAADEASPVETTSGYAYLFSTLPVVTGTDQYFHVKIYFYDNINFEHEPLISVDSRYNLEAFINEDPYISMEGRGIFLKIGESTTIIFDATHFRPGYDQLSIPYGFESNRAYFPKVFVIPENNEIGPNSISQNSSFSCSKCTRFGDNNFDSSGCSFSFSVKNDQEETRFFNFQIDFYADADRTHLIRRFNASPGHTDLQFMEINNLSAESQWDNIGLKIEPNDIKFIQVYPGLDAQVGFLCGIKYYIRVNSCSSQTVECITFNEISPTNWRSNVISADVPLFTSVALINDHPSIAWQSSDKQALIYSERINGKWVTQTVNDNTVSGIWASLSQINKQPAIAYVRRRVRGQENLRYAIYDGKQWSDRKIAGPFDSIEGVSLIDNNGSPIVFYAAGENLFVSKLSGGEFSSTNISSILPSSDESSTTQQGLKAAVINNVISVVFIDNSGNVMVSQQSADSSIWSILSVQENGMAVGTPSIADINGNLGVAFVERSGGLFKLVYKQFNSSWVQVDTMSGVTTINKVVSLANINGQPAIIYLVDQGNQKADVRYTRYDGRIFRNQIVESNIDLPANPHVDIISWNSEAFLSVTNEPFHVYFFNQETAINTGIKPTYFCECSSNIFIDKLRHIDSLPRWQSSGFGFADTRITDTTSDSMRPVIKTRSTDATIILWEEREKTSKIKAATFKIDTQDQLRSSGTKSWFDYNFDIVGQDAALSIDMFDRVVTSFEVPDPVSETGFYGKGISPDELPTNSILYKNCDFEQQEISELGQPCDISKLEANILTSDPFLSSSIIKKIKIKDQFVDYYTYNIAEQLIPVVSNCNIILEIFGTPEVVAYRIRNENSPRYGSWCPWSPKISDYYVETEWTLSPGQGIKQICIQVITYSGITTEFCLSVVGDYLPTIFEARFFTDPEYTEQLPSFDGMSVASTGSDPSIREKTVYVEIIPNIPIDNTDIIKFDIFQQGSDDKIEQTSTKVPDRNAYRGNFIIQTEDRVRNVDGLARIRPRFSNNCENIDSAAADSGFQKDKFNAITKDVKILDTRDDLLSQYRQSVSGRVGVDVMIRGTEDPYFVFGDPNWMLKKQEGKQVPSGTDTKFLKSNLDFVISKVAGGDSGQEPEQPPPPPQEPGG